MNAMDQEPFVIPTTTIAQTEGISAETVRRVVKRLRDRGEIDVELSPTGRARLTVAGYERVRAHIRGDR
jgi:Mn-dependent DtxR family transcriptional regulator